MSIIEWAKSEVEIASKKERGDKPESEWDYGVACYESALKALESLCADGHSDYSIGVTKHILNRLIDWKPLTPIEDTEEIWELKYTNESGESHYQCKRMSSLFKVVSPDGQITYHDINRYFCVDEDNPDVRYYNGFVRSIYDEMCPMEMPYMPTDGVDKVVCAELLTDPKNGDYDTMAILYIQRANGEKVEVNRYFKEGGSSFIEITFEEYMERKVMDRDRKIKSAKAEAIKEFAERLKKEYDGFDERCEQIYYSNLTAAIDDIGKEMTRGVDYEAKKFCSYSD